MKVSSLYCFLVSTATIGAAISANDNGPLDENGPLENLLDPNPFDGFDNEAEQIENLDPSHRDLFFKSTNQRKCIGRELADFNDMFDAIAYRDLVISDAGMDVDQLRKARKEAGDEFDQTPEYNALMDALEKHSGELKRVEEIISACQDEANGGTSAVGAGALVGTYFAKALVQEQITDSPSSKPSSTPSSTPSTIPTTFPTPAPQRTFYPSYVYPTFTPTISGAGTPIFIGVHFEASFFLEFSQAYFITGAQRQCIGLTSGLGGDISIIVMISTTSDLYQYRCSQLVGVDAGLGASVGAAVGAFSNNDYFGCNGPAVVQVTIGAGAGFSVDISGCNHSWL